MKWITQIATALLATTALAAPAPPKQPGETTFYNLRISSRVNKNIDGKLLSVHQNQVGVHPGSPAVRFFPVDVSDGTEANVKYQLHTHPIGIVESVLGLVGTDGLGTLTQISDPYSIDVPDGTRVDWSSWDMVEGIRDAGGEPAGTSYLEYLGSPGGRWIAFPSGEKDSWVVTWDDGTGVLPQHYMPINVTYEQVE
ncbi:hypothetical protein MCOR25_001115 [Pyricularia grisea]|uniref:Uncharacterized protein n=1 Tax=Pyricularia grisea TaxID=148305 RepID=A0A6P8AN47_PYRGI|nr:uncharacterized protein PgNI_11742 [Pyricularia grisea]KAI6381645.1 hypothetical protein MCOR25_001115 [Pyricularia grisea]TLD03468.1 hypothetical protein PgNI_11742 [Pyricularia grisea]